jgi:catechol 2,3-dioxygenase-like lactoylglutathione lyase family enzyme
MVDHVGLPVRDFEAALRFYDATLPTLGMSRTLYFPGEQCSMAAYGHDGKMQFFISSPKGAFQSAEAEVCLVGGSADRIRQWHSKCVEAGAKSLEAPTAHPDWHPGYYGATIADPSGWRIDACIHDYSPDQ